MKRTLSYFGAFVSLGFLAASAVINHTFGFALGRTLIEQHTFGIVAILAVAFNGLCPFFMQWATNRANWAAASLLWVLCLTYSVCSAIGFAAENRAGSSGVRVAQHGNLRTTETMLTAELAKKKPDQRKIEQLRKDTIHYRNQGAHVAPDNQSKIIAQLVRLSDSTVNLMLVILFALLIEIGAALGLYASLSHLSKTPEVRW